MGFELRGLFFVSIDYLNAAFKAEIKPSSLKFVLVSLADYANEEGEAYPSVQTLCNKTCQDRKTVLSNLKKLVERGIIFDTGDRKGRTKQIPVFRLSIGTIKQSQKRDALSNSPENGTVPKTGQLKAGKSPENGTLKESQKRDIEPSVSFNHQLLEPPVCDAARNNEKKIRKIPVTQNVWNAYRHSYQNRYGVDPLRNAKVNGLLAKLVRDTGDEVACQLVVYFVNHDKQFYVQRRHDIGLLVSDVQSVHTDMMTNSQMTAQTAREIDAKSSRGQRYNSVIEKFKQEDLESEKAQDC